MVDQGEVVASALIAVIWLAMLLWLVLRLQRRAVSAGVDTKDTSAMADLVTKGDAAILVSVTFAALVAYALLSVLAAEWMS